MSTKKIEPIKRGTTDTLLSAARANELIRAINAFLNMMEGPGIKITRSEKRIIIERIEA